MIMVKFKFQLNAGFFVRNQVRIELRRSKEKLEYVYSDSSLSIREEKNWFLKATFVKLNERKGKKERSRKWVINEVDEMTGEKKLIY